MSLNASPTGYDRTSHEVAVVRNLGQMLADSPGYRAMDHGARAELDHALGKIAGFLDGERPASSAYGGPLVTQMAPDLMARIGTGGQSPTSAAPQSPSGPSAQDPTLPSGGNSGGGTVGRVGDVARATLNAINFPDFVASLIQGTFQAIVDASIQQMEAYAELLKNVATTVDRFMQDNISDGMAKDYLADQYGGVFNRDTSGGAPRLAVRQGGGELPSFFKDLGFNAPQDIDDQAVEQVIVPATRQHLAERRQQTLATMVLMGINRVVVKDGEINAKLMFHIDASESMNMKFDQNKVSNGNMSGYAGRSPYGASSVMVNTASVNAQSNINVRADLTGQVTVRFASETFPLERFADSNAIQLINQNAKVPEPKGPPAAQAPAPGQPPAAPAPASAPKPPPAAPPAPKVPAAQGLAYAEPDPWAP